MRRDMGKKIGCETSKGCVEVQQGCAKDAAE